MQDKVPGETLRASGSCAGPTVVPRVAGLHTLPSLSTVLVLQRADDPEYLGRGCVLALTLTLILLTLTLTLLLVGGHRIPRPLVDAWARLRCGGNNVLHPRALALTFNQFNQSLILL